MKTWGVIPCSKQCSVLVLAHSPRSTLAATDSGRAANLSHTLGLTSKGTAATVQLRSLDPETQQQDTLAGAHQGNALTSCAAATWKSVISTSMAVENVSTMPAVRANMRSRRSISCAGSCCSHGQQQGKGNLHMYGRPCVHLKHCRQHPD